MAQGLELAAGQGADYVFKVETFNATSWKTLWKWLKVTDATVVLAQEVGTLPGQHASHSRAALELGWQSIFACSVPGDKGHTRSGVAIFARPEACMRKDPHCPGSRQGRLLSALLTPPGWPEIRVISAYLATGAGIKGNAAIIADIGQLHTLPDHMPITGADWNIQHCHIQDTDIASKAWSSWIAPGTGSATCITPKSSHAIDYFLVGNQLAHGMDALKVRRDAGTLPTGRWCCTSSHAWQPCMCWWWTAPGRSL